MISETTIELATMIFSLSAITFLVGKLLKNELRIYGYNAYKGIYLFFGLGLAWAWLVVILNVFGLIKSSPSCN